MQDREKIIQLVNETEAAQMLALSVKTLRKWRWSGGGPKWRKIGGKSVRYSITDLQAYIDADIR